MYQILINFGYGWEWASEYDNIGDAQRDFAEYVIHVAPYNGKCKLIQTP